MPQRILKPAWSHLKSPISIRSIFAFFLIGFIAYTVVTDYQQKQASIERFQAITAYMEESQQAIEEARKVGREAEITREHTEQMLTNLQSMDGNVKEMTAILKENNEFLRSNGNSVLSTKTNKKKVTTPKTCYTLEKQNRLIGDMLVTQDVLVKVPCN